MKPKFRRFTFVYVSKPTSSVYKYHRSGFNAIVRDIKLSVLMMDGSRMFEYVLSEVANGKVVNELAWYPEEMLSAVNNKARRLAEDMVNDYIIGHIITAGT